jgi:SHS2 domain-containing protein
MDLKIEAPLPGSGLVKGVTYHRLRFERSPAGWKAGLVLDV